MTRIRTIMLELFVLALLVVSSGVSLGQLSVQANEAACEGLACKIKDDCGSKCFCNGPSGHCFLDSAELQ